MKQTVKDGWLIIKLDWRKPEDYETLKEYSMDKWAWEFLRRNPEYCREYRKLTEGMKAVQKEMAAFYPGCQKWDLQSWLDPDREYQAPKFTPVRGGYEADITAQDLQIVTTNEGTVFKLDQYETTGEILFRFDTRKPINPQIEAAKKELLELQRNQSGERQAIIKPRRGEWITLLRVLDATAAGATDKQIAEALFPSKCPVDETANECPLNAATATGVLDDEAASKCPLGESTADKCPLENPSATIKKVYDKKQQATKYVNDDYRMIPFLTK